MSNTVVWKNSQKVCLDTFILILKILRHPRLRKFSIFWFVQDL